MILLMAPLVGQADGSTGATTRHGLVLGLAKTEDPQNWRGTQVPDAAASSTIHLPYFEGINPMKGISLCVRQA